MANTILNFTRELISGGFYDGKWNINNPERGDWVSENIDLISNQYIGKKKTLLKEIKNKILGVFSIVLDEENVTITFEEELSQEQKNLITQIVSDHKNNV